MPVLSWTASQWPSQGKRAQITYWSNDEPTRPVKVVELSEVIDSPGMYSQYQTVEGVPGVRYRVSINPEANNNQAYVITVVEEHGEQSEGIDSLRVHFQTEPEMIAQRITHRFDAKNGIVAHTFVFDQADQVALVESNQSRVTFTRRQDIQQGASQLPSGRTLIVDIYDSSELFPVEAAAGVRPF